MPVRRPQSAFLLTGRHFHASHHPCRRGCIAARRGLGRRGLCRRPCRRADAATREGRLVHIRCGLLPAHRRGDRRRQGGDDVQGRTDQRPAQEHGGRGFRRRCIDGELCVARPGHEDARDLRREPHRQSLDRRSARPAAGREDRGGCGGARHGHDRGRGIAGRAGRRRQDGHASVRHHPDQGRPADAAARHDHPDQAAGSPLAG